MKNLLLIFILLLSMGTLFSQSARWSDSVIVSRITDDMTDEIDFECNVTFLCSNDGKKGIQIQPYYDGKELKTFIVNTYKMGSECNKNSTLIIKFVDGTKIKLSSWNKFSCTEAYFSPRIHHEKLSTLEIEKVYFMNGSSYESGVFPPYNKRYFIQYFKGLKKLNG